jgi:hypothetical protein
MAKKITGAGKAKSADVRKVRRHALQPGDERTARATGTRDFLFQVRLLNQTLPALSFPLGTSDSEIVDALIASLIEIAPTDGIEGMLAAQMVAVQDAAMDCLKRARHPEQTYEGRQLELKAAKNLMQIFNRQVEALGKHRGKGQQRITVEHVAVHAGGQAIVGNVDAGASKALPLSPEPPAVLDQGSGHLDPGQEGQLSEGKIERRQ